MRFSVALLIVFSWAIATAGVFDIPVQRSDKDSIRQLIREWKLKTAENRKDIQVLNKIGSLYLSIDETDSAEIWIGLSRQIDTNHPETIYWQGRIFLKKGEIGIIPFERVLSLLKQDNHSKAIREFSKVLEIDPDHFDARFYLAKALLAKGGEDNYVKAISSYEYILERKPGYPDLNYELSLAFYEKKDYSQAIRYLNIHSSEHPEDSRPYITMSNIDMELGKTESASRLFLEGVVRLRDPDILDELFLQIKDISSAGEQDEFHSLPMESRGFLFKKFWKKRDPTPFTEENERYTEHFRRVRHARHVFSYTAPPYYDDRGRVYVKYGEPDIRYQSTMSTSGIKDNESWSYEKSIQKGLVFDFVQYGAHFSLVQDLTSAGNPGTGYASKMIMAGQLYSERAPTLGGLYNKFSITFQESDLMDYSNTKAFAEKSAPPEVFRHDYKANPLPFFVRSAQFRGESGLTRLEIYHSVLGTNLGTKFEDNSFMASINSTVGVFDPYFNEIDRKNREVKLVGETKEQINDVASIDEAIFLLRPDSLYHVILKIENPEGEMLGISRLNVSVREFDPDSLQISNLELASKVDKAAQKNRFYKDGLWVLPYTFSRLNRNVPTTIYYEIYNLNMNTLGQSDYTVDYKVTSLRRKESGIKKVFRSIGRIFGGGKQASVTSSYERQGDSSDQKEYISLDIRKMPAGVVELSVTVTDRISLQTKTSAIRLEII